MEKSKLKPFLRKDLDILFVGLNPAKGSNDNGHYFSVKQSLWNQLYESGLIIKPVDKKNADEIVFGDNKFNYKKWNFGITDLVTNIVDSDSGKINPSEEDCLKLKKDIITYKPKIVIILHSKVLKKFVPFLGHPKPKSNMGYMGLLIDGINTIFYNIAFPHYNNIHDRKKVDRYKELKKKMEKEGMIG